MIKTCLIIIFSLIQMSFLFSQNANLVQVKGMVVNQNREPLPYVRIIDITRGKGLIARSDGEFSFFTEKGDSLLFSYVGYKDQVRPIPSIVADKIYYLVVVMKPDTFMLPETDILPWKTYEDFKKEVLVARVPEDDLDRAAKNLALMELQQILYPDDIPSAPGAAAHLYFYEYYDKLYWKGQTQPMQIFNIMAWQKFFQYLKEGKFKQKEKPKSEYELDWRH